MTWSMLEKKRAKREADEFEDALMMVKEGTEILCELYKEMEDKYSFGEKGSYGNRGSQSEDFGERRSTPMRYR